MAVSSSISTTRLKVYQAWMEAWVGESASKERLHEVPPLDITTISHLFQDSHLGLLLDPSLLLQVVTSLQRRLTDGDLTLGTTRPPSAEETNLLSGNYDPRVECNCDGVFPIPFAESPETGAPTICRSIERLWSAQKIVLERQAEWNGHGLFTAEKLQAAVEELTFCNCEIEDTITICSGASITAIPVVHAPDRRPSATCDSEADLHQRLFPTAEKIKLCADAKYFDVMACAGSGVDEALTRAIADAGNDVLIGDYCEAASADTLRLLQQRGAAALAFVKACHLAGLVRDWHMDIIVAAQIQFRVLGYYRNHAAANLPGGLYGSRMTALTAHRHIDIAHAHSVVLASLATGESVDGAEYMQLSSGTTLLNDLVDFRSDTTRRQRENPILRGIRGCACTYLHQKLVECLVSVRQLVSSKRVLALATMGFCNWCVMASHHKVYEVLQGVMESPELAPCDYPGLEPEYRLLLDALHPYGSLGAAGPHLGMKRMDLDRLYSGYRQSPKAHVAWLADIVRILLKPSSLRKIVDIVHYQWVGDIGQADYCP